MACDVDELDINPFFSCLQTKFSDLYETAQAKCYTICIPQSSSIQALKINRDFAETHILKPSPYFKGHLFTIHSSHSKQVILSDDGHSLVTYSEFQTERRVKIISEELAYNKEYKPYRIIILNQPLDPKFQTEDNSQNGYISNMTLKIHTPCTTFSECTKFLKSFPDFSTVLEKLDQGLSLFNRNYMVLPDYLTDAAMRLEDLSKEAVKNCLKQADGKLNHDLKFKDVLTGAVESYVMGVVHRKVFQAICERFEEQDKILSSKICDQLRDITAEELGIQSAFACPLPKAVEELLNLGLVTTPLEKLTCLKSVVDNITSGVMLHLSQHNPPNLMGSAPEPCITSDDLIPILVMVIAQAEPQHLQSNIFYMENFIWSSASKDRDDLSYCLVTFKAAVQYMMSTDFSHLPRKATVKKQSIVNKLTSSTKRLSITKDEDGDRDRSSSPHQFSASICSSAVIPDVSSASNDRISRQQSRISRTLQQMSDQPTMEPKVKSIFGVEFDVPAIVESVTKPRASPQLGDFLSALQDDLIDQPFGKQA